MLHRLVLYFQSRTTHSFVDIVDFVLVYTGLEHSWLERVVPNNATVEPEHNIKKVTTDLRRDHIAFSASADQPINQDKNK